MMAQICIQLGRQRYHYIQIHSGSQKVKYVDSAMPCGLMGNGKINYQ